MESKNSTESIIDDKKDFVFPQNPFESIGLAVSGGGFRAAAYTLGMLSILNALKLEELKDKRLLENVSFVSSASGGTITMLTYTAALRKGVTFPYFFNDLDKKLAGEELLSKALDLLSDDQSWNDQLKSCNPINSFARVYNDYLLDFLDEHEKSLSHLIDQPKSNSSVQEFCFNASEFYTGLSFRFQGGNSNWIPSQGGRFGNSNIGINWDSTPKSINTIRSIRLGDIIASSSCFPMGFEPLIYPRDFTYKGGPSIEEFKEAVKLDAYSWGEGAEFKLSNLKSKRAAYEKSFADNKEFGLMDGGICDNQGLWSLMEANKRKTERNKNISESFNRFDLMMVSDVTSFYMNPYKENLSSDVNWGDKTPKQLWKEITVNFAKVNRLISIINISAAIVAVLFCIPLLYEGKTIASVALAVTGILLLACASYLNFKKEKLIRRYDKLADAMKFKSLEELFKHYRAEDTFSNRLLKNLIVYLQDTKPSILVNMLITRVDSTIIMVSDIFLKHIRRLIYEQFFTTTEFKYRRLDNPIYRLSYSNAKNRRLPSFDDRLDEDKNTYKNRKEAFVKDVNESCKISDKMQDLAEIAYNTGTTLWFTPEDESGDDSNVRKAVIVTGQFSTCYSLLRYTLSLKHSRYYNSISVKSQIRIDYVLIQLKKMMDDFEKSPFYLYESLITEEVKK